DRRLEPLARGEARVAAREELVAHVPEETGEEVDDPPAAVSQRDLRLEARVAEQALEGAEHLPARLARSRQRLGAEEQLAAIAAGHDRRHEFAALEGDDRVVAAVFER